MILQREIIQKAEETGVPPDTIDKNWVLGHFLAELYKSRWAQDFLIFKGGTCLKKCYFTNYRFSEDLDFTLISRDFLITDKLIQSLCDEITAKAGILFSKVKVDLLMWENAQVGYYSLIRFWGANHRKNQQPPDFNRWQTAIKIEIVFYELMVNIPENRPLLNDYSDFALFENITVPCYSISEIMAEKFRALLQRSYPAPRDYYDLWHLLQHNELIEWDTIISTFRQKNHFKKVEFRDYRDFFNPNQLKKVRQAWNNSLQNHLSKDDFPDFDFVIDELYGICRTQFN